MKKLLIKMIKIYQGIPLSSHKYCRFQPTCSEYAIEAIEEYGAIKGTKLALKRLSRCRPGGGFGYDPVIKRSKKHEEN
jgi:putative membrane protein insertion efficiency factor